MEDESGSQYNRPIGREGSESSFKEKSDDNQNLSENWKKMHHNQQEDSSTEQQEPIRFSHKMSAPSSIEKSREEINEDKYKGIMLYVWWLE